MAGAAGLVDVAVGVVVRADGAVLLGQRPPGKPYAGWWEFPGGKLERGESVEHALARELHEELGLEVRASCPWVVREFTYPHARVRLHFQRVYEFGGEPHGREGQAFVWQQPGAIDVAPLLPATVPVIGWLRLPEVCEVSAAARLGEDGFLQALERRLAAPAGGERPRLLLLDEPALAPARFEALFHRVVPMCRARGAQVLVGGAHDPSFRQAADGVIVGARELAGARERPATRLAGACCADAAALERAGRLGFDFAVTRWPAPAGLLREAPVPVFAAGAVRRSDLDMVRRAGAHGLALAIDAQRV